VSDAATGFFVRLRQRKLVQWALAYVAAAFALIQVLDVVAQRFGWHHTGDLGMWGPEGQMLFLDRKKDMIKTGGENVASVKVEAVVLAHPGVAGAAVLGLPHPRWAEAVCAFVVRKPGADVDEAALLAHCKARLGSFEVPKLIRFVDALPATATGKVQKHVLRRQFAELAQQAWTDEAG